MSSSATCAAWAMARCESTSSCSPPTAARTRSRSSPRRAAHSSALTDSLTLGLLRQVWRHGTPPSPSLASITTGSIPALTAFLQGERLSVAGRWAEAALSYDAAFRLDTTFWLAAWRHNEAQQWIPGEPDQNDTLQAKYEAHLAGFGQRDRLLIGGEATSATEPFAAHLQRFRDVDERFATDWAVRSGRTRIIWCTADHSPGSPAPRCVPPSSEP